MMQRYEFISRFTAAARNQQHRASDRTSCPLARNGRPYGNPTAHVSGNFPRCLPWYRLLTHESLSLGNPQSGAPSCAGLCLCRYVRGINRWLSPTWFDRRLSLSKGVHSSNRSPLLPLRLPNRGSSPLSGWPFPTWPAHWPGQYRT